MLDKAAASTRYFCLVFAVGIVASLSQAATPLVVDGLVKYARFSLAQAGSCTSIELFGQCAGTAAALVLIRRFSPRSLLVTGLILTVTGNLLSARILGFAEFAVVRMIAGAGCGLLVIFEVLIAREARPQRNFAIFTGLLVVSSAALSAAMPSLLAAGGVSAAYLTIAILAAACMFGVGLVSRDAAAAPNPTPAVTPTQATALWRRMIQAGYRNPAATLASAMVAIYSVSWSAIWTYLGAFGPSHAMSDRDVANAISVAWLLGGTLGAAVCAWTEGRVNLRHAIIAQLIAVAVFAIYLGSTTSPLAFWLTAGMFVFLTNMCFASFMSLMAGIDPTGRLVTAASLIQLLAFVAGPAIGAVLLDGRSFVGLLIFVVTGLLLAAACLVYPGAGRVAGAGSPVRDAHQQQ